MRAVSDRAMAGASFPTNRPPGATDRKRALATARRAYPLDARRSPADAHRLRSIATPTDRARARARTWCVGSSAPERALGRRNRLAQPRQHRAPARRREARGRPLEPEDRDQLTVAAEHRRSERVEVRLALAGRLRPALRAHGRELVGEP